MKILFSGKVPHHISDDLKDKRTRDFQREMNIIIEKYANLGFVFDPLIKLPVHYDMDSDIATIFEFPEDLNVPKQMQLEIASAWSKLWEH